MKGDFSRFTFNEKKHYRRVLMQQGRVQLDADINEQQAIVQGQAEDRTCDIIGPRGVPKNGGGFEISLIDSNTDLAISAGTIYVDGILCRNEKPGTTYLKQDDLPQPSLPKEQGTYLVYLDVFSRSITAIDDPLIREKALGGADTSIREKTVWQVKLKRVKEGDECSTFSSSSWQPLEYPPSGEMKAEIPQVTDPGNLCTPIPPASGYRKLENQFYRVEIHKGGDRSLATFKWSRENGSIEAPIRSVSGKTIALERMSRDEALGFGNNQWIEIVSDNMELGKGVLIKDEIMKPQGVMVKSYTPDGSKLEIPLQSDPGIFIDIDDKNREDKKLHPRLRRWDQENGDCDGIRLNSAEQIELEGGIYVSFQEGTYYPGDFWLIPARAAIGDEIGEIEWPKDENDPTQALFQPRHGVYHHYCPLALLEFKDRFLPGIDCRPKFPPLTKITAKDVELVNSVCKFPDAVTVQDALDYICKKEKSKCTMTVWPGDKWADIFNEIEECIDIYIFFQVGTFKLDLPISFKKKYAFSWNKVPGTDEARLREFLSKTYGIDWVNRADIAKSEDGKTITLSVLSPTLSLVLNNEKTEVVLTVGNIRTDNLVAEDENGLNIYKKRNIKICGCGKGTKIIVSNAETAFSFEGLERVDVESLYMESTLKQVGASGRSPEHLNGTLTFTKCNRVSLKDLELVCGDGTSKTMACIKIAEAESVRVMDCDIMPGNMQVGILVVDAVFTCLERNIIKVMPGVSDKETILQDTVFRAGIRSQMIRAPVLGKPEKNTEDVNVITVESGKYAISFRTHPKLAGAWRAQFEKYPPPQGIQSNAALLSYVKNVAVRAITSPSSSEFTQFKRLNKDLEDIPVTAAQGVVIGGSTASEVRIINNSIIGVIQGVHIGMRKRTANPMDFDSAEDVWISGNEVKINLIPGAKERHGIFVGNCHALHIKDNHIEIRKSGLTKEESIDGIRIYGHIGRRAIVRQNYIEKASIGVNFAPIRSIYEESLPPQWVVAENMISGSINAILIPAKVPDALYALIKIENNYPNNSKRLTDT